MEQQSKSFLDTQLDTIMANSANPTTLNQALCCVYLAAYNKSTNLKILETFDVTTLGDYFILITVDNISQALGLSDQILFQMKKFGLQLRSREGHKDTDWILMDYGDFVVHIFVDQARERYDLDQLWINAPRVEIPQEFYLHPNSSVMPKSTGDDVEDYL